MTHENDKLRISTNVLKMGKKELERRKKAALRRMKIKARNSITIEESMKNCPFQLGFTI
jgi:hypothetical protein